jgi:transposase InsO family protein
MDQRRKLALEVIEHGVSLSEACRRAGVTRKTGRKWVVRARESGLAELCELSRAPRRMPVRTDAAIEQALLAKKQAHPKWGPRKLVVLMEPEGIKLPVRTAERILARHGLTCSRPETQPPQNFERESCGALLQMDFKGLPKSTPFEILTVLDDHSRFVLGFGPVPDKSGASVKAFLWELFKAHGLPDSMLMDNGDCWGALTSRAPTAFEAWLMKLGIKPIHGRICHPQTQGKVERFHLTAKQELEDKLFGPDIDKTRKDCREFLNVYNWIRPHDSLAMATPGSRYTAFPRERPDVIPEPEPQPGDVTRKVRPNACVSFKGRDYKVGRGLIGERVQIREQEFGPRLFFANFPLAYLAETNRDRVFRNG